MLTILGNAECQSGRWTRRRILQAGGAGLLGLSLPRVLAAELNERQGAARQERHLLVSVWRAQSARDIRPQARRDQHDPRAISAHRVAHQRTENLRADAAVGERLGQILRHPHDDASV